MTTELPESPCPVMLLDSVPLPLGAAPVPCRRPAPGCDGTLQTYKPSIIKATVEQSPPRKECPKCGAVHSFGIKHGKLVYGLLLQ